jgi:hypothetical protein
MIPKIARYLFVVFLSVLSLYLIFLSAISIFIGLINTNQTGFWVPILCGSLLLFLTSFVIRLMVYIIKRTRSRGKYLYV